MLSDLPKPVRLLAVVIFLGILGGCYGGGDDCCDDPYGVYGGSALSANRFAFAGTNGSILFTENGGNSFTRAQTGVTAGLRDIKLSAAYGLSTGKNGTLLRATPANYGLNWNKIDLNLSYDLNKISFGGTDYSTAYIAADEGNVLKSSDSGSTWQVQRVGVDYTAASNNYGIGCADKNTCWSVGAGGKIYSTLNGGNTWSLQNSDTTETLNDIFVYDKMVSWAVGRNGTLVYTVNGGSSWERHNTGFTEDLSRVYFRDRLDGLIVGKDIVARTSDGGEGFELLQQAISDLKKRWLGVAWFDSFFAMGDKDCDEPHYAISLDFGDNWNVRPLQIDLFGVTLNTPTPEPTQPQGATPTAVPSATATPEGQSGSTPTPTPVATATNTPGTSGPTGCAAVSGLFRGDNGCGIGSVEITQASGYLNINPFGTNGSQKFNVSGASANSQKTDLFILGVSPHTCRLSCAANGTTFDLHCERTGNPGISCDEQYS